MGGLAGGGGTCRGDEAHLQGDVAAQMQVGFALLSSASAHAAAVPSSQPLHEDEAEGVDSAHQRVEDPRVPWGRDKRGEGALEMFVLRGSVHSRIAHYTNAPFSLEKAG